MSLGFLYISIILLQTLTLQMCFCISARLYLIVSRHCSVQFIQVVSLIRPNTESVFFLLLSVGEHSYSLVLLLFKCFEHRNEDVWLKILFVLLFLDQQQHECRVECLYTCFTSRVSGGAWAACFVSAHISEWQHSHMGSYKTCFSRSTDTHHVKQSQ